MMTSVFWNITQCSPLKVNGGFGGTYRLLLQDERISTAPFATSFNICCMLGSFMDHRDGDNMSETSVYLDQTTLRYISEGRTICSDTLLCATRSSTLK
jgi:hypothetical protein